MFKKGDVVNVRATVYTKRQHRLQQLGRAMYMPQNEDLGRRETPRPLMRDDHCAFEAVVVGHSVRITGIVYSGRSSDDPGSMHHCVHHRVILVVPLNTERWVPPLACLEADLDLLFPRPGRILS